MIRLSDYVMECVAREGVKHVFMVSGGGGMYLIDSLGRRPDMTYVCNHHEQASAMSAEGYQRATGNLGVALVTTGPAGTNAITGVLCSWNDSIPLVVLSGQANSKFLIGETGLRQRGVHEANITKLVESVTKYAVTVTDETEIRYHMEKALFLAKHGRPGPVWIDIPLDIQSKMIEPDALEGFDPVKEGFQNEQLDEIPELAKVVEVLQKASRPVVLAGHGIRLAGVQEQFLELIQRYSIPVVTTKNALDLISEDNPLLAGRIGINGQRAGNFAVQNADVILVLGSRLAFPTVGYATELFGREATKIVVDVDELQLKHPTIKVDLPVRADLRRFISQLSLVLTGKMKDLSAWVERCQGWRTKYPAVRPEWKEETDYVNPYYFFEVLSEEMSATDTMVTDQGATFYASTVSFKVKQGQRVFTNGGFSPMGYGLPAAIGACFGNNKARVICAHGEGGLQMNVQELQTVRHYNLPIKLFVFNNQGYLSIKHTQTAYFEGLFVGCDPDSGVSCPDTLRIAEGYQLPTFRIVNHNNLRQEIRKALEMEGPVVVDVMLDPMQPFVPKVASERKSDGRMVSKPLEDMYPFIDRDEFKNEMIVKPVEE